MNGKKVRRAGRCIQLRRLAKRFKESGTFDPAVFESPPQSNAPPQDAPIGCVSIFTVRVPSHVARIAYHVLKRRKSY